MSAEAEAAPLASEAAPNGTAEASAGANPDSTEVSQAEPSKTEAVEDKPGQPSGKTMFVMNIPTNMMFTFEDELKEIFSKYGEIKIIKRAGIQVDGGASDDVTLSAYIHFTNAESAEKSLEERGRIVGGNPLEIFVLKTGPNTVVADILPVTMKVECIKNLLVACGPINEVVKIPGRRTAFIEFQDEEGAKKALSLNTKLMINNVKIIIEKRDGNSKPVVGQKSKPVVNKPEVRRPFKRPGVWTRGGYSAPSPVQPPSQPPYLAGGAGGRGGYRGGRGGTRGVARGGYRGGGGGYAGGYWGNDFNSNDQSVNKRRKPNDWIRQY